MREFAELYRRLDETTKTSVKRTLLRDYFARTPAADAAWAVYFLSGQRLKRLIKTQQLRRWCQAQSEVPDWLFDECYATVGDLAETIALLLPTATTAPTGTLAEWIEQRLVPLAGLTEEQQQVQVQEAWRQLDTTGRLVFTKLVTGSFRVGVQQRTIVLALADLSGLPSSTLAHRLMGNWQPTADFYADLLVAESAAADQSRPYPFCLAHPLQTEPASLGPASAWWAEWKWDGIRGQILRRGGATYLWSRGEEPILERFPELSDDAQRLPNGTVLDGEVVGWAGDRVLPFAELQRRIGRKQVSRQILAQVPARFVAFDLLEHSGRDLRDRPFAERRLLLEQTVADLPARTSLLAEEECTITLSRRVSGASWAELAAARRQSRTHGVEGLMLKRLDSRYEVGRVTGVWWKWKIDPYACDAVLVYAQPGHGRRANLYTDYTFAVWEGAELVPFAKAYSGLDDAEIAAVDRFVRQHTLARFGPVRQVEPRLVFELAFEGIQPSPRHRAGLAVRFPRIARWRHDKRADQADTLATLQTLLAGVASNELGD